MNVRAISRNVGVALLFEAAFMFASAIVAAINHLDSSFYPLLLSGILTFCCGIFPIVFVSRKQAEINTREGVVIILLSWVLACLFGMMPFALWGGEFTLSNAWFESVSGITTSGATILSDIESLPKGLLFWRSSTHYIGGLGVVLFMVMILPSIGSVRLKMSRMEVSDVTRPGYNYKTDELKKVVLTVYIGLTLIVMILYMVAGMNLFDAVNHAMSTVATGGFSTKNASIGAFESRWIEIIAIVFMTLSSMHFGMIYVSIARRDLTLFKHPVTKFYLMSIIISGVAISLDLLLTHTYTNAGDAFLDGFFNVASLVSSTGFAVCDTSVWPLFCVLILMYLSIQCGCSGSTSAGMKVDRVWILFKATYIQLQRTLHPNAVLQVKYGDNDIVDKELITSVAHFAVLYIFIAFICAVIYAAIGMDMTDSISASVAMIGNIGPAFGHFGSLENYAAISVFGKLVMTAEMIIGRLGLYSVLSVFLLFRKGA
ncbi:MAG: TrkH family potassium uptake protein [Bacteroidales bacterium]|nr:TrkH family potassium uptake protein [Bacteroidales bacterium]